MKHAGSAAEARSPRHREVEREQIGLVGTDFADRRGYIGGLGDHLKLLCLALEHCPNAIAHDGVIVGDDHLDRAIDAGGAVLHPAHRSGRRELERRLGKPRCPSAGLPGGQAGHDVPK